MDVKNLKFEWTKNGEYFLSEKSAKLVKDEACQYMRAEVEDHVDWDCLEVNSTSLAEDAASHFNLYGPGSQYPIPFQLYDWAMEIAIRWEKKNQVD